MSFYSSDTFANAMVQKMDEHTSQKKEDAGKVYNIGIPTLLGE